MKKNCLVVVLLMMSAGCLATNPGAESEPGRHAHADGAVGMTQHFEKSLFQMTDGGNFSVEAVPAGGRFLMGENSVDLIIHNTQDHDVTGASVTLTPWMPLHGHGAPSPPEIVVRGGGLYTVGKLYLSMAGPWEMRVAIAGEGVSDKTTFVVPVGVSEQPGAGHHHMDMNAKEVDYGTVRSSDAGLYAATYSLMGAEKTTLNHMQQWKLHLETADLDPVTGARITISGGMPDHGHNLPTSPMVTRELGNGDYLVEGLKFTMPGWWQVIFTISASAGDDTVTFNLRP